MSPDDSGSTVESPDGPAADANPTPRRWVGYGLAVLVAAVFAAAVLRVAYPVASVLALMSVLVLFGVFVVFVAVRERTRGR